MDSNCGKVFSGEKGDKSNSPFINLARKFEGKYTNYNLEIEGRNLDFTIDEYYSTNPNNTKTFIQDFVDRYGHRQCLRIVGLPDSEIYQPHLAFARIVLSVGGSNRDECMVHIGLEHRDHGFVDADAVASYHAYQQYKTV